MIFDDEEVLAIGRRTKLIDDPSAEQVIDRIVELLQKLERKIDTNYQKLRESGR